MIALIVSIISSITSVIGWFLYWIVGPILLYIVVRLLLLFMSFCDWNNSRKYAPSRGYKRRGGKWFE